MCSTWIYEIENAITSNIERTLSRIEGVDYEESYVPGTLAYL
jgi:multidrug efflux pump subunit AcrB